MTKTTESDNKKNNILTNAIELFSQRGFEGVSVRDIAEASDCNLAAISYYFGGKEKLYDICSALIDENEVKGLCSSLSGPLNREDFVSKLNLFSKDMCRLIQKYSKVIRIHINKFNCQEKFGTDLEDTVLGPAYKAVREFLNAGWEINLVRKDINDRFHSRALVSLILSEVIYHGLGESDEAIEKFSQEISHSFANAVS